MFPATRNVLRALRNTFRGSGNRFQATRNVFRAVENMFRKGKAGSWGRAGCFFGRGETLHSPTLGKRKKKQPSKAGQYAQYLALRTVSTILHCLPLEAAMQLASWLGDLMYRVDKRHRNRSLENLRASFPEKSEAELHKLVRDSFRLFPHLGVEMMLTPRYMKLERMSKHLVLGDLGDALRLLVERERGVILVTGHYGNWEVLSYSLAVMGFHMTAVARGLDNPYINAFVLGVREKQGQRIVDKRGAIKQVPEVLDQHGAVGFTADQDAGTKGMFVNFFGRPASTYKSIGILAMRYEVPVVVGFARRLGFDFRFQLDVADIIRPEDWRDRDDPLRYITQRYTKAVEDAVRGEPGQYLWLHRRWKTQPKEVKRRDRPIGAVEDVPEPEMA